MSEPNLTPFSGNADYNGFFCGTLTETAQVAHAAPAFLAAAAQTGTSRDLKVESGTPAIMGMVTTPDGDPPSDCWLYVKSPSGMLYNGQTEWSDRYTLVRWAPDTNNVYLFVITAPEEGEWTIEVQGNTDQEFFAMAQTLPALPADQPDVDVMNDTLAALLPDDEMARMMSAADTSFGCTLCKVGVGVIAAAVLGVIIGFGAAITVELLAGTAALVTAAAWAGQTTELLATGLITLGGATLEAILIFLCAAVGACNSSSS